MSENNPLPLTPPASPQSAHKKSRLRMVGVVVVVVFVLVAVGGIIARAADENHLKKKTNEDAITTVGVITAQRGAVTEEVTLPGTVQAWHEAVVYARTAGYIKSWAVDIGAHVKEGDVLAEIEAPDLDAQFHQAQADLQTAEANYRIAQITAKRYLALVKTDSIAQQTADQAVATADADMATVNSQKANLDHLQQEEDFKNIVAPFDGVITERNIDVGTLINGGNSGTGTEQDAFHISDISKLRIYVQVPENDVAAVQPDLTAELHFPQHTQQIATAKLSSTAEALDPTTRTLLIQLEVDNADGALLSGGYTDAHIKLPAAAETVILPVNTLLFRDGEQVGVVTNDHVALKKVTIGRDYGKTVEIVSGVSPGDIVVINPPDSLQDGQHVHTKSQDTQGQDAKDNTNQDAKNTNDQDSRPKKDQDSK
jgi:RND family efflux transporter MFP subunit